MLTTGLCDLLRVLVLAGAVIALLPDDLEDHTVPVSLQKECASKCPNLDLTQVRGKISLLFRSRYSHERETRTVHRTRAMDRDRSRGTEPLGFTMEETRIFSPLIKSALNAFAG
jgi:hypothetical protein